MHLTLNRCVVRAWQPSDAESLQRHADNPNVARHLRDRFPHPYTMEHATGFLGWVAQQPSPTVWAIAIGDEAVGGIGIERHGDVERVSAEIGYWLGEAHWGKGVATEALVAVTAMAFQQYELTRVFAVPFADHLASVRVLEKAGYVREGLMRRSAIKYGVVRDQLLFATYRTL